jgi:hypothetical protein
MSSHRRRMGTKKWIAGAIALGLLASPSVADADQYHSGPKRNIHLKYRGSHQAANPEGTAGGMDPYHYTRGPRTPSHR